MSKSLHRLLVCTVGGAPEPVVRTLRHWCPARVLFVPSAQTRPQAGTVLREYNGDAQTLGPGQYEIRPVEDAEDMSGCLQLVRSLAREVRSWLDRGDDYEVIVDFTAGTKCMSAALVLEARRWRCRFSYVGGAERTKDGIGIVQTGAERVVHSANPWEELGFQAIDDFVTPFNQRALQAAEQVANQAKRAAAEPSKKREFSVIENLAKAFRAWDHFDHKEAGRRCSDVLKRANDLKAILGTDCTKRVVKFIERYQSHLEQLASQTESPTKEHVIDLLANAKRREEEGRFGAVFSAASCASTVSAIHNAPIHGGRMTALVDREVE